MWSGVWSSTGQVSLLPVQSGMLKLSWPGSSWYEVSSSSQMRHMALSFGMG